MSPLLGLAWLFLFWIELLKIDDDGIGCLSRHCDFDDDGTWCLSRHCDFNDDGIWCLPRHCDFDDDGIGCLPRHCDLDDDGIWCLSRDSANPLSFFMFSAFGVIIIETNLLLTR